MSEQPIRKPRVEQGIYDYVSKALTLEPSYSVVRVRQIL
jgi:hypothetical protein